MPALGSGHAFLGVYAFNPGPAGNRAKVTCRQGHSNKWPTLKQEKETKTKFEHKYTTFSTQFKSELPGTHGEKGKSSGFSQES